MLTAAVCDQCGHRFQTQFAAPPNQMQRPAVQYHSSQPTNGPIDNTERAVALAWTCIGLLVVALVFVSSVHSLVTSLAPGSGPFAGIAFFWLLIVGAILSALTMRLRRLYISSPDIQSPYETARRRARFAVVASVAIVLLVLFGIFFPETPIAQRITPLQPAANVQPSYTPPISRSSDPPIVVQPYSPPSDFGGRRAVPDGGGLPDNSSPHLPGFGGSGTQAQPGPTAPPQSRFRF
jgi:hypothetical protein